MEIDPGVHIVPSVNEPGLSMNPHVIHQGANSGYQAINLAVLMGAKRIALLGFDMKASSGDVHWHGKHPNGLNNPTDLQFQMWLDAFRTMPPDLEKIGVEVINCTPDTALDCFPLRGLESVL